VSATFPSDITDKNNGVGFSEVLIFGLILFLLKSIGVLPFLQQCRFQPNLITSQNLVVLAIFFKQPKRKSLNKVSFDLVQAVVILGVFVFIIF